MILLNGNPRETIIRMTTKEADDILLLIVRGIESLEEYQDEYLLKRHPIEYYQNFAETLHRSQTEKKEKEEKK